MKRRLTRPTAEAINAGLQTLLTQSWLQTEDSRRFASEISERLRTLLSGEGDTFETDWEASDWGDIAYLISTRQSLGLRELAAKICTGLRRLGNVRGEVFNCTLIGGMETWQL